MANLSDRCFCWLPAAMLVPLWRAPTWRLHTKLYKFRWNCLPNNTAMKNRTDLNLGDAFCLSIIYHIPDSWLNLLNGYDFYFRCKQPIDFFFAGLSVLVVAVVFCVRSLLPTILGTSYDARTGRSRREGQDGNGSNVGNVRVSCRFAKDKKLNLIIYLIFV